MSAIEPTPVPAAPFSSGPAAPTSSRFGTALALGFGIAVLGVVGWALIALWFSARFALISFGVAAGIAAVMRVFAPNDRRAPVAVVVLTALSALVGQLASQYGLLAEGLHISYFKAVDIVPSSELRKFYTAGTSAMTWIIMAISVYAGFAFARQLSAHRPSAPVAAPQSKPSD
jgi:hypothetical protein